MNISMSIDWLRWTVPTGTHTMDALPYWDNFDQIKDIAPLHFYTHAVDLGVCRIDWCEDNPDQRKMITFAGKGLQELRDSGRDIHTLLRYATKDGANVTRLDFAVDVTGHPVRIGRVRSLLERDKVITPLRTHGMIVSKNSEGYKGATLYIGSRSSNRFVRIYDKAAEQSKEGDWWRIELELKGRYAQTIAGEMLKHSIVRAGQQALWDVLKIPVGWYTEAIKPGREIELSPPPPQGETNHEKWLRTVALPAVIKAIRENNAGVTDKVREALA